MVEPANQELASAATPKPTRNNTDIIKIDESITVPQTNVLWRCLPAELEVEADSVTLTGGEDWDAFADINEAELPPHLKIGSEFTFRVSIAQAAGLSADYADVFCQFK